MRIWTRTDRVRAAVLLLAAALVATGCGSSGSIESASKRSGMRAAAAQDGSDGQPDATGDTDPGGPDAAGHDGSDEPPSDEPPGSSDTTAPRGEHREDVDEFCRMLSEPPEVSSSGDPSEALGWMRELRNVAPTEIVDDLDVFVDMLDSLANLDEDDPASFGAVFEILMDPRMGTATENYARVAAERCDLEGLEGFEDFDQLFDGAIPD